MHSLWHWLLYVLAWASHDPASLAAERARCAGAVNVAYAALAQESAPTPRDGNKNKPAAPAGNSSAPAVSVLSPTAGVANGNTLPERVAERKKNDHVFLPQLPPAAPCVQCSDTGRIYRSDGGWVRCPCGACSRCKPAKALP